MARIGLGLHCGLNCCKECSAVRVGKIGARMQSWWHEWDKLWMSSGGGTAGRRPRQHQEQQKLEVSASVTITASAKPLAL